MLPFSLTKQIDGSYTVKGDLTFVTLDQQSAQSLKFLAYEQSICIDFAQVNSADSAGLALVIEWIKRSELLGINLVFKNTPQQLLALAKLCDFKTNKYFI